MFLVERVKGIEPFSPTWKAGVIATIRYPRVDLVLTFKFGAALRWELRFLLTVTSVTPHKKPRSRLDLHQI